LGSASCKALAAAWHWLFLINLPIGILAVVLAFLFLPDDDDTKRVARGLDIIGLLLLSPGLVLFLYGSDHLGEQTGVTAILLSMILLAAFVFKASKDRQRALIDLQLFRSRVFSASAITQFTTNGLSFVGQMLIPIYLTRAASELAELLKMEQPGAQDSMFLLSCQRELTKIRSRCVATSGCVTVVFMLGLIITLSQGGWGSRTCLVATLVSCCCLYRDIQRIDDLEFTI
jgi:hypothetical protein